MQTETVQKLDYIDASRGIAILLVVMVHTSHLVPNLPFWSRTMAEYGQMGVQLFFLVSAFTLCLSAEKRGAENQAGLKFAIRRFFRIAPLYWAGIALYFVTRTAENVARGMDPLFPAEYSFWNVLSNVLFIHGFVPSASNAIVPGGWSIGTEMAFYVLFPLLWHFASGLQLEKRSRFLWFIAGGLLVSQILLGLLFRWEGVARESFLYGTLFNQLPVFTLGIGYYFYQKSGPRNYPVLVDGILFMLFTSVTLFLWTQKMPVLFSVIPFTSGLSFVFLVEMLRKAPFRGILILPAIGKVSYSMYILHFLVVYKFSMLYLKIVLSISDSYVAFFMLYSIIVAVSYGLARISERYFEQFFIEMGRKMISKLS